MADDEQDYEDDEEDEAASEVDDDESGEDAGNVEPEASGDGEPSSPKGMVDSLMAQIGEHKDVLAPIATSAAAAAATYAAKKLPELIDKLEQSGSDGMRSKLDDAADSGGLKGFVSGAASRALSGGGGGNLLQRLTQGGEQEAESEAAESGGLGGAAAKAAGKVKGNGSVGGRGWGKGRRLPIMRSIDVAAPISTVYDQWTQFEELSAFMHRVEGVEQREPETIVWHENIWGRKRDWNVEITEQIPRERIAWEIKGGGQGVGVLTFHELAPKLTRIELVFDWQPEGIVEKIGSGLRVHKRAAKTDLYRFKAFVETRNEATGGWRGRIEDGKAKSATRNRRNSDSEPIPSEARQHSEDEGREDDDSGSDDGSRAAAREERKRAREQRARGREGAKA